MIFFWGGGKNVDHKRNFFPQKTFCAVSRGYVDHKLKLPNSPQDKTKILLGGFGGSKLMIYIFGPKPLFLQNGRGM